jgi:hypothetical protein
MQAWQGSMLKRKTLASSNLLASLSSTVMATLPPLLLGMDENVSRSQLSEWDFENATHPSCHMKFGVMSKVVKLASNCHAMLVAK